MLNLAEVLQKERIICRSFHPKNIYTHLDPRKKKLYFLSLENFYLMKEKDKPGNKPLEDLSIQKEVTYFMCMGEHYNLSIIFTKVASSLIDDVESISYVLLHLFTKGNFFRTKTKSNKTYKANDMEDVEEYIRNRKHAILPESTLKSYPECLKELFIYIKKLGIIDKPDIDFIRNKFMNQLRKESINEYETLSYHWAPIIMDTLQLRIRDNNDRSSNQSDLITAGNSNSEDEYNVLERDSDFFRPTPKSFTELIRKPYSFSTEN